VITSIQDGFPRLIKKHELLVLVVVIISFLFGLPHITEVGLYISHLFINFQMFFNRSPPNIFSMIKSRRMRWVGHVAHMGQGRCIKGLVGRPEGKRPLGQPTCRWEDTIKMHL
jgi:hypothetical protein